MPNSSPSSSAVPVPSGGIDDPIAAPKALSPQGPVAWAGLDALKFADEEMLIRARLAAPPLGPADRREILAEARKIVVRARARARQRGVMESFLEEFGLSNKEGLALMCLAEALLRVPDEDSADRLIAEKIRAGNWADHRGKSPSLLVNASTWGLMLTGRLVAIGPEIERDIGGFMRRLVAQAGEPVVRAAMMQAMRIMGEQFVLGRNIGEGLKRGAAAIRAGRASNFSFDMLGEGARTAADAQNYFVAYAGAIERIGAESAGLGPVRASGVSVKLSALHPRYEARQADRIRRELLPALKSLALKARAADIGFCFDAEEADRLVLSLELFESLARDPELAGWNGLGLAVQAYQKRAPGVVAGLVALGAASGRRLMVRLVKGAYWDYEIKRAQMEGRPDFPVWTQKSATDYSFLQCAQAMLAAPGAIYPQFATHNAGTLAAIRRIASLAGARDYEFQRLHGMGEALYGAAEGTEAVRVYAPIGAHEDLLPYLVRRLLENGANTSFVHGFLDDSVGVDHVVEDPQTLLEAGPGRHPRIPAPLSLFGARRRNSRGRDLSSAGDVEFLRQAIAGFGAASPPVLHAKGDELETADANAITIRAPHDRSLKIGIVHPASEAAIARAASAAKAAQPAWDRAGGAHRGKILRAAADLLEDAPQRFLALATLEAGKTLADSIGEIREAVDFLRFYAGEAERLFSAPERLPGPAGETNHLSLHGRGVFACVSPWNFPLAIFMGQVAAALAAGNCVLAKPAPQTPLIASEAVALLHRAGVPENVLHLLPGGAETGRIILARPEIAGCAFTGSSASARAINRLLADKDGPIAALIAETGGLNGMFVDTTALKEQVSDDVIASAFGSAGQRCSALRILFLPQETADGIIAMLKGAMAQLRLGDPARPETDIGPVIDEAALDRLRRHRAFLAERAQILFECDAPVTSSDSCFFPPLMAEIPDLSLINEEVFGPILHILRYDPDDIGAPFRGPGTQLAAKGFGLTLGAHTRLDSFVEAVREAVPAGNYYVNRSMIGAMVGVQPFGGEGLSGTGPKAGGPFYLPRFAVERCQTVNIAAQGGDPELLNL